MIQNEVKKAYKKDILQLQTILKELRDSSKEKNMTLSYPRFIIDSWDYSDQLGTELMELAELYKKLADDLVRR